MGKIFNPGLFLSGGVSSNAQWGNITGTLSDQTDLQTALNDKQDTLVSGTNIKTVNGNSLLGSGNVAVRTYQAFKTTGQDAWRTTTTIANFCHDVDHDADTVEGMAYLGGLSCSDLPFVGNADAVVEIISGTVIGTKVIKVTLTSGNRAPYHWEYTYWNDGNSTSGWIGFQPQITYSWFTINATTQTLDTQISSLSSRVLAVYKNGAMLQEGQTNDYTISGSTISFTTPLIEGDKITVGI